MVSQQVRLAYVFQILTLLHFCMRASGIHRWLKLDFNLCLNSNFILQNCCPCLHQRGALQTRVISHLPQDIPVLRQVLTKSIAQTITIGPLDWLNIAESAATVTLHAATQTTQSQRPKQAVGGQRDNKIHIHSTVVAQLSEPQVSHKLNLFRYL